MATITIDSRITVEGACPDEIHALRVGSDFLFATQQRERGKLRWENQVCQVLVESPSGKVYLPFGCLSIARATLRGPGHTWQYRTTWFDPAESPVTTVDVDRDDRDGQIAALRGLFQAWERYQYGGVIIAPCGAGKTWIGMRLIEAVKQPTLILVHTKELQDQWIARLREAFPLIPCGRIGGGKKATVAYFTVAMVQTLKKCAATVRGRFGMVIMDECHHAPAQTFCQVLHQVDATIKVGLTASETRGDNLHPLVIRTIGPIVARISQEQMVQDGAVLSPVVRVIYTGWTWFGDPAKHYSILMSDMQSSKPRNAVVIAEILRAYRQGRKLLVLTAHIAHLERLYDDLLQLQGLSREAVQLLHGQLPTGERGAAMRRLVDGFPITLATRDLAKEALDAPPLDTLVWAVPCKDKNLVQQSVGRVQRAKDGKLQPLIIDFRDETIRSNRQYESASKPERTLYRQWIARKAVYEALFATIDDPSGQ